jgi:hypothetical protein
MHVKKSLCAEPYTEYFIRMISFKLHSPVKQVPISNFKNAKSKVQGEWLTYRGMGA